MSWAGVMGMEGRPSPSASADPSTIAWLRAGAAMQGLRQAYRRPAFAITMALVGGYMLNILIAGLAPGFLAIDVIGPLNIGLFLLLLQSGAIGWAAWWSGRYATESLDPLAASIRDSIERLEGGR